MVYNTLSKDERTRRNIYLLLLKNIGVERSPPFFRTMYPNRNHVTAHPVKATFGSLLKSKSLKFNTFVAAAAAAIIVVFVVVVVCSVQKKYILP